MKKFTDKILDAQRAHYLAMARIGMENYELSLGGASPVPTGTVLTARKLRHYFGSGSDGSSAKISGPVTVVEGDERPGNGFCTATDVTYTLDAPGARVEITWYDIDGRPCYVKKCVPTEGVLKWKAQADRYNALYSATFPHVPTAAELQRDLVERTDTQRKLCESLQVELTEARGQRRIDISFRLARERRTLGDMQLTRWDL